MSVEVCLFLESGSLDTPHKNCLDAHASFVAAARKLYAPNVIWTAPARGIEIQGCERLIRHLLREGGGMHDPEFTLLRRNVSDDRIIDEFAVRFVYAGEGLDHAPIAQGDFVELKRVRVLTLHNRLCTQETCIESWCVLLPADGSST